MNSAPAPPKILDFGVAKLVGLDAHHARTQTGVIMGTPTYMSPEQCRAAGTVDHRTDIYALGGVLFHVLTGRAPFAVDTTADMIASHLLEEPRPPSEVVPGLSADLDAITLRCLSKRPEARPATMSELAAALARCAGDTGEIDGIAGAASTADPRGVALLTTVASGAGADPSPARRSVLWPFVALGAALAVVAAIGAVRSWRPTRPYDPYEDR